MKTLFLVLGMALAMLAPARAAVFIAAHQDDIVLMMARSTLLDIASGAPTVLVVLTAGDAGNGSAPLSVAGVSAMYYNQMGNPYYRVRHNAHEAAISAWAPPGSSTIPQRAIEFFSPEAQLVEKVRIANVTIYNLNLPDGRLAGLQSGKVHMLTDITGVNRYTAEALRETLQHIIARHHQRQSAVRVHLPEHTPEFTAPGYNDGGEAARHGDHADHTATGRFVRDALALPAYACVKMAIYMGYGISATPDSMNPQEKLAQIQAYTALDNVLKNQGNVSFHSGGRGVQLGSMDSFHMGFFGKQRWRDGGGGGTCAFGGAPPALPDERRAGWHHIGRLERQAITAMIRGGAFRPAD